MPKVTSAYKEEKRNAILDGALYCFAEKGYRDTTISDIAHHLSISKGAIYIYFTSKEDIYCRLMEDRMKRMIDMTADAFNDIPDAAGKLTYLMRRFSEQPLQELRRLLSFHLEFTLFSSRREDMKRVMDKHADMAIQFVVDIIAEGKRDGEFRQDADEFAAAEMFWALRDGLALHALQYEDNRKYASYMAEMETMVFRYLR